MTSLWRCEMNIFTHMWTNIKRIFSHIWEFLFCSPTQHQQYCERGAIFGQKASTLYRLEINCLQWTLQFGKAKFRHQSFLDQKQHFFGKSTGDVLCSVFGERGENDKTLDVQISCFLLYYVSEVKQLWPPCATKGESCSVWFQSHWRKQK